MTSLAQKIEMASSTSGVEILKDDLKAIVAEHLKQKYGITNITKWRGIMRDKIGPQAGLPEFVGLTVIFETPRTPTNSTSTRTYEL